MSTIFSLAIYWFGVICGVGFGYMLRGLIEIGRQGKFVRHNHAGSWLDEKERTSRRVD